MKLDFKKGERKKERKKEPNKERKKETKNLDGKKEIKFCNEIVVRKNEINC